MRRFNFDEYIKNPSKEVVTRDGKTVRILCTDADSNKPIVALVRNRHFEQVVIYGKDGVGPTYSHDLFFATVKNRGWLKPTNPRMVKSSLVEQFTQRRKKLKRKQRLLV